jgi:iron complex transport system substrate-binding protein
MLDTEGLGFFGTYAALADLTGTTDRYAALQSRYRRALDHVRGAHDGWDRITISMVMPYDGQFWVVRDFGAFAQVMADLGIRTPTAFAAFAEPDFEATAEFLPQLDADFLLLSYVPGDPAQGTPETQAAEMERAVPGWCDFLHACRTGQVLSLPREEIYARSFVSLKTALDFIAAGVVGRPFVDFPD